MAKGGMRYGAGRPGYRLKAQSTRHIDIGRWHRGGHLREGAAFSWAWTCDGESVGSIGVNRTASGVRLAYSFKDGDGWRDASQHIAITSTPCHLGGSRPWFTCPACGRRAGVLFLRSGRFACRRCQRISYESQSASPTDRLCSLFHRLEAQVEEGKPKWQRWATFDRLCDRHERVGERFDAGLFALTQRLGFDMEGLTKC